MCITSCSRVESFRLVVCRCVYFLGAWVEEAFTRDFYRCVHKAQQPPANSRCLKQLLGLLAHVAESYPVEVNRVKLTMLRVCVAPLQRD